MVIDQYRENMASRIASGLYNPLVLKRFRVVWRANEHLEASNALYPAIEKLIGESFYEVSQIREVLNGQESINKWLELQEKPLFEQLIDPRVVPNTNPSLIASHLGLVTQSGRAKTAILLNGLRRFFSEQDALLETEVNAIDITNDGVIIQGIHAREVILCEGNYSEVTRQYFPNLPLNPTKGQVIHIHAPELQLEYILHKNIFIMPMGGDIYKVGATYEWSFEDDLPNEEGQNKLEEDLKKMISCPYEVVEQFAGVRPNTKDRRPLLGTSELSEKVHIFNGLGSRGVLMAPWLSKIMTEYLVQQVPLPEDCDIKRFS